MGAFQPGLHLGHPTCSGAWEEQAQHRVGSPAQGEQAAAAPEAHDPREEGLQKGGARAAEVARATAQPGSPPQATAGKGPGSYATESTTYSAVFLREEVGAVIQAFLLSPRARRTEGEEGNKGDTKRDISARPAPSPRPPARPPPPPRAPGSAPP